MRGGCLGRGACCRAIVVQDPVVEDFLPWCSARVEVLDHPLGLVRLDVGSQVHDAAAPFFLWKVARHLGHVSVRALGSAVLVRVEFGVGGPEESFGVLFDQVDDLVGDDEGEEPVSHRAVEDGLEEDVAAGEAESCQAVPCCRPRFDGAVSLEPPVFEVEFVADGDAQCADGGAVACDCIGVKWAGHDAVAEEFRVTA